MFGALSYAELGCLIPKTGGEYIYLKTAFSDLWGFLFVWSYTFIYNPAVTAFASFLFSDSALKSFFPSCEPPVEVRLCLAAASTSKLYKLSCPLIQLKTNLYLNFKVIITGVNCFSVRLGQTLGYIFNFGKIAGLFLIMAFGVYGLYNG